MSIRNLSFPSTLEASAEDGSPRPVIKMSANVPASGAGGSFPCSIYLPCPAGLGGSDAGTYNDAELRFIGGAMLNNIERARAAGNIGGAFGAGGALSNTFGTIGTMADNIKSALQSDTKRQTAQAILTGGGDSGMAKAIGIGLGTTLNKNITTEFTGVGTRAFQFQFKLVPSSISEARTIDTIIRYLRRGVYPTPTPGGLALLYPPKWKIEFLGRIGGNHLTAIPRIGPCFLESIGTTYNSSNAWHDAEEDQASAPVETDIQISFKEERAFTTQEFFALESGSLGSDSSGTTSPEAEELNQPGLRDERGGLLPGQDLPFTNN